MPTTGSISSPLQGSLPLNVVGRKTRGEAGDEETIELVEGTQCEHPIRCGAGRDRDGDRRPSERVLGRRWTVRLNTAGRFVRRCVLRVCRGRAQDEGFTVLGRVVAR